MQTLFLSVRDGIYAEKMIYLFQLNSKYLNHFLNYLTTIRLLLSGLSYSFSNRIIQPIIILTLLLRTAIELRGLELTSHY